MLKKIQPSLILALCAASPVISWGATRTADEAKIVAAEFFQSGEIHRLADKDAFTLVYTASDGSFTPVCYVLNAVDGQGFVIISADEDAMPVIGYSDTNTWDMYSVPDVAAEIISSPVAAPAGSKLHRVIRAGEMESKLLQTPSWSQEAPFNNNIPNRRLTGCVGVALAEILKYHSFPAVRPASLVGEGQSSTYAWDNMRDDNYRSGYSQEEADAVATLVADAAIAIGTDFGQSSSSAFEVKVPYALTSLLGYDAGVSYKKRSEIDRDNWDAIIVNEIEEERPVLYSGQDVSSGHAFVCDGYEKRANGYYFHINWGWGGSANGYFASDALNPTVSRTHRYNDLNTIVYNIKPATNNIQWSPLHITSDERQVGLTLDVNDISGAGTFSVRAGALKNISNTDFSGKLSVALFDASGNQKCLLNDGRNFSLVALQIVKYVDFTCTLPSGTAVSDGDVVRLVTRASDTDSWLPVAGDLLAPGEMLAKGAELPYFTVSMPDGMEYVEIYADDNKVIKGRDYSFRVVPTNLEKVVTVKANGYILTADASNGYKLTNVIEDQNINVIVQDASEVLSKSTLWLEAGNLQNMLTENETATIEDLTLFGTMNVNDFTFIRDRMKLSRLDISQVNIVACGSSPANAIPTKAFSGYRSLKTIILPSNLNTLKNGCFNTTGLTSIEIPASVSTYEYNIFVACSALREVIVRRSTPAWVNWCVFSGTPKAKLIVPPGAAAAYRAKEYWQEFKEIIEQEAVAPDTYKVTVQEVKGLKITPESEGTEFAPGTLYTFTVESDDSFGDANMEVYANSTRLYADKNGKYNFQVGRNTLIHIAFKQPEATTPDTAWKLTGATGGVGLVTEVMNVRVGQAFTVRANAVNIPYGPEATKFFAMVLTDKNGNIKEFISPVYTNSIVTTGNQAFNFSCQVNESLIREGNLLRLATSYNKKVWNLVEADADSITDRISALGNTVIYHNINMPQSINGAKIDGAATQVIRGMPFNMTVTPVSPNQRVTLAVNGINKAVNAAVASLSIPSVTEDLDITIQINDAGASDYVVVNVKEGELAAKIAQCPERLKVIGTMLVNEFDAFRDHASTLIDLDLADVNIKGPLMTSHSIPESAFAPKNSTTVSALRTIILPQNLERIDPNAFYRCTQITEITIPASVTFIGSGAFSYCVALKKITAMSTTPPSLGSTTPFPANPSSITLVVPRGAENVYRAASYWNQLTLYQEDDPKEYYWIKYDPNKILPMGTPGDLNRIEVGTKSAKEIYFFLPNIQNSAYTRNPRANYRPGVPFRLYDNGFDVVGDLIKGTVYPYPQPTCPYPFRDVLQSSGRDGGKIVIKFIPNQTDRFYKPQNHELELVFYYPITFQNLEGADGTRAQFVNLKKDEEWKDVSMSWFNYNDKSKKNVYREGSDIQFKLIPASPNVELSVKLEHKVMTQAGANPKYEWRYLDITPDINGIYTIPELPGDTWVKITGSLHLEEGVPVNADDLGAVTKEDVEDFTELTVTGNMDDADFDVIRDNFDNLETLDLSQIENETIPEGAFEGMDHLRSVVLSETVTEIGAGSFKDCENLETLNLTGVTSIGEGAFDGCTSLTSIMLPSAGNTSSANAPRRTQSEGGITVESFKGINPNCLIYMGSADIPDAEDLNIILNIDGTRVAASDIVLDGNHSFNAPASFNLGSHRISFTVDIPGSLVSDIDGGWKGIMLPFSPSKMEYGVEFGEREGSGITLISFDSEEAEIMTPQTSLVANRPYLANVCAPYSSVPVTFYAVANTEAEDGKYDVPFSPVPEETVAVGKEFSLYGSYDGETTLGICYTLDEDGKAFIRPAENDTVTVRSFDAYLRANEGVEKDMLTIGNHPYWVCDPAPAGVSGLKLYRNGKIEIASATKGAAIYYTIDGSDPSVADGTRKLYETPLTMEDEQLTINAVAEYKGHISDKVVLDFELKKAEINYDLAKNWNWISHNAETSVAVADFATEEMGRILSQTQEVVRDANLGLVGTLRELKPTEAYKVFMKEASASASINGIAFDPSATVVLHRGWNWIGSPVDDASLLISDLFAALEAEEGDMIVGLDGFEQADAEGIWTGTLTSLIPGVGYMYYSNSDKEFAYTLTPVSADKKPVKAESSRNVIGRWVVDTHRYPSVMPVTATLVDAGGTVADANDYAVAAFCGDECRGIGVNVNGVVMINVHGVPGDMISFRFITPDDEEIISETSMSFSEKPAGAIMTPYEISLKGSTTSIDAIGESDYTIVSGNGFVSLEGNCSAVASVDVYDLSGNRIAVVSNTGKDDITINGLETGFCIIVIRTADSCTYSKVLVK